MNRLKELRKEQGLTLAELSKKLEIPSATLSSYERGDREPKQETWQKLADFFGVSVPYLMGYVETDVSPGELINLKTTENGGTRVNLYELSQAWTNIAQLESDDEELLTALNAIEGAVEEKAHSIGCVIKNLDGGITALKDEVERLTRMKKAAENKQARLKEYLQYAMEATNLRKIETPLFKFSIQKNPASLVIQDESLIPEKFKVIKYDIDKPRLKEALKSGDRVSGAELVQKEGLRIR